MVFFSLVLMPALREGLDAPHRTRLVRAIGWRYRRVGWISIGVLLITGLLLAWKEGVEWQTEFGQVLILKLTLVAVMLLLTILHDFLGTRPILGNQPPKGNARRLTIWIARGNLFVVLVIIVCGVWLTQV